MQRGPIFCTRFSSESLFKGLISPVIVLLQTNCTIFLTWSQIQGASEFVLGTSFYFPRGAPAPVLLDSGPIQVLTVLDCPLMQNPLLSIILHIIQSSTIRLNLPRSLLRRRVYPLHRVVEVIGLPSTSGGKWM